MEKVEFDKDANLVTQLSPIVNFAQQIARDVDDMIMLAGSDAFYSALLYYGSVNEAHRKGVSTAQPIYEDLKQQFAIGQDKQNSSNYIFIKKPQICSFFVLILNPR